MRTKAEIQDMLDRFYLWDGSTAYFTYNDWGSIGECPLHVDTPAATDAFLGTYEELLSSYEEMCLPDDVKKAYALCDAVTCHAAVYVTDSPDCLLYDDYLIENGIALSGNEEVPGDVRRAFEEDRKGSLAEYASLMERLADDSPDGGFIEPSPYALLSEMRKAQALPALDDFKTRYPRVFAAFEDSIPAFYQAPSSLAEASRDMRRASDALSQARQRDASRMHGLFEDHVRDSKAMAQFGIAPLSSDRER